MPKIEYQFWHEYYQTFVHELHISYQVINKFLILLNSELVDTQ